MLRPTASVKALPWDHGEYNESAKAEYDFNAD